MDSNASAAQDSDRAAYPAPDAPAQRLEGGDTQSKADNRPDTKADNSPSGKGKSQASHAANSNSETIVDAEDASQPVVADETGLSGDAVTIILSGATLAAAVAPKRAADDIEQAADTTGVATSAIPAIIDSAAAAVAIAIPVASAAAGVIATPAPEAEAKIATIQSIVAGSAAVANSSPDALENAVATQASNGASPAALTTGTSEATSVATPTTNSAAADEAAIAATTNAASSQTIISETASLDPELAANAAASAQASVAAPANGKKPTTTAPPVPTQVITSADAEAASARNPAPSLPGQTADAVAPRGAEVIGGAADKTGTPTDMAEALPSDPKQSTTPVVAAPAEHRAPTASIHSASLDLGLQAPQTPLPQSVQVQTPNIVVNPAAQLNATLANTPVPINGLAVDIALRAAGGASRFEIRLDPAELGRIDVRLDVDKHGNVTSHLTVEKPSTLDMLRRDAPQLQRALEDAGLKTGDSGLQFSLRDQSSSGRNAEDNSGRNSQRLIISEDDTVPAQVAGKTYGRMLGSSGGVDIRV